MTEDEAAERRRRSASMVCDAMDVLEAATTGVSAELVVPAVRAVVARLDEDQVRGVAAVLAVEAVWNLPPAVVRPRTGAEIRARLVQLRHWIVEVRLSEWWASS